jgi:hypothetical protein
MRRSQLQSRSGNALVKTDGEGHSGHPRRLSWLFAFGVGLGTWLVLAFTAPQMPIVWDEGEYLFRADQIAAWFRLLLDGGSPEGGLAALSQESIRKHWLFINWSEGHPAWFAIPIAAGKGVLSGSLDVLTAARLGPITVFSIACAAVAIRLKHDYGTVAALAAPAALLTLPRMFSEAHFATQDGQLTAWWLILWAVDSSVRRGPRTAIGVGVLLGLTCATKFTGWFAVVPVVGWRAIKGGRQRRAELLAILPVALLTFYAVNPPLWHAPATNLAEHFRLNLRRPDMNPFGVGASSQLPGVWAGRVPPPLSLRDYLSGSLRYDAVHRYAPWYNTLAWLVLVTPISTLVLGFIGLRHCAAARTRTVPDELAPQSMRAPRPRWWWPESSSLALLLHWATLMIVRALPGAPANDGIRFILPAFGFWCVLAGIGAQRLWPALSSGAPRELRTRRLAVGALLGIVFAANAWGVARYYPQTLSHYSLLVGGVRGAASIGLEPTYWWDALDDDVLEWLNTHTEPGASVGFSLISDVNVALLRDWGRLRSQVTDPNWRTPFAWYVLQNRPSLLSAADRILIDSEQPAYAKYAGHHPRGVPADLDVPLILVFSYEQYQRAMSAGGVR